MSKDFFTIHEILDLFNLSEQVLDELVGGDVICPYCAEPSSETLISSGEMEKLRLAKLLLDMDVNVPGVEVILRMRQAMFDMRRQFDEILRDLLICFKKEMENRES